MIPMKYLLITDHISRKGQKRSMKKNIALNMKGKYQRCFLYIVVLCLLVLTASGCGKSNGAADVESQADPGQDILTIEVFYNNPCESCDDDLEIVQEIKDYLESNETSFDVEFFTYNIFKGRSGFLKRLEAAGLLESEVILPAVFMNGRLWEGEYAQIGSQFSDSAAAGEAESDVITRIQSLSGTDSAFILFTTYACGSCDAVKTYLDTVQSEYGEVVIIEANILSGDNSELLTGLMDKHALSDDLRKVPILFYKSGYLSGEKAIKENMEEVILSGTAIGLTVEDVEFAAMENILTPGEMGRAFGIGLVNGLNPCALSMLLMVLSILIMSDKNFLSGSMAYMTGKFCAYLAMGAGAFFLLSVVKESLITGIGRIITIAFAIFALVLGILNFVDYWNVKNKNYGKVIVQLPKGLRGLNHKWIRKLNEVPKGLIIPMVFVLGVLISAGEFFCTGQLYLASIIYMSNQMQRFSVQVFVILLLYVSAMCLPQIILIMVLHKTRNLVSASRTALQSMPAVKLINGIIFFILFIALLFF